MKETKLKYVRSGCSSKSIRGSLALCCVAFSAFAEGEICNLPQENPNDSTYRYYNYNSLIKKATDYTGGYYALTNGAFWADGENPSSDKDYRIWGNTHAAQTGAMAACAPADVMEFNGKSLLVGNADAWSSSWLSLQGPGSGLTGMLWIKNDGMKFGQNSGIFLNDGAGTSIVTGRLALVNTTLSNPARVYNRYCQNSPLHFALEDFSGTSTDVLNLQYSDSYAINGSPFVFSGDMSNFHGTLRFTHNTVGVFRGVSFPGRLYLEQKTTVDTEQTAVEVDSLFTSNRYVSVTDNRVATVKLGVGTTAASSLKVNDSVTVTGTADHVTRPNMEVEFSGELLPTTVVQAYTESSRAMTLLDVPASGGRIADQFALDKGSAPAEVYNTTALRGIWSILMHACFYDEETVGDRRQLNLRIPRFTYSTNNESPKSRANPIFGDLGNFYGLTSADSIEPDRAYVLTSSTTCFMFPGEDDCYTFPGAAVVICDGCWPVVVGMAEITNLVVLGTCYLQCQDVVSGRAHYGVSGNVTFVNRRSDGYPGGTGIIYGRKDADVPFDFQANLHGDGAISIAALSWESGSRYVRFAGDNSDFSGTIKVGGRMDNGVVKYTQLEAASSNALGGALPEFNAAAVDVANYGVLKATADVVLSEPTRGLKLEDLSEVNVASGKVFAAGSTTTFTGTVAKSGQGTFKLAGTTARLGAETPTLAVAEGALMPARTDALENLAVTMAPNAVLAIDGDSTDSEYVAKGIDLAKANISFGGRKKVVIRQQAIVFGEKTVLASGTAGQAAAFASGLQASVSDGTDEKRCLISVEDSAEGYVVSATYTHLGMSIIFR